MPPFGGSPYSPGPEDRYDYRPGSAITDLILRAGDVRARQQERSGEIWGQTVAGLGQMAGQALGDYQQQKANSEREAAWGDYLENGDWHSDPLDAYKAANRIWGSQEGAKQFEGLMAVQKLTKGEIKTPEQAQEYLGHTAVAASKLSDESLARFWPVLSKAAATAGMQVPEQYDPSLRPQITEFAKAFGKKEAIKTREIKTRGPGGVETTRIVEDVPGQEFVSEPEPAKPQVVGGSLVQVQPGGGVTELYKAPEKPAGAGAHSWVMRDGRPVRVAEGQIQPGDTPYESAKAAVKKMPAGSATELGDMQTGLDQSAELRKKLAGGTAGALSRAGAAVDAVLPGITKATGWGQEAKNQQAVIGLVKQIIGKSLEGGVLRKEDEIKYTHMIPVLGDSDETVKTKLDTMDTAIQNKRDNALASLSDAGYDTTAFEARLAAKGATAGALTPAEEGILKKYGY